jgi:hypothetical protein
VLQLFSDAVTSNSEIHWEKILNPGGIAILGGFLFVLIGVLAQTWLSAHRTTKDTQLKQDMLDRGMSAEDIVKVINAGREVDNNSAEGIVKIMKAKKIYNS